MKGLPGRGPWRILDECEAPKHNTLRAHAGRHGRDATRTIRCYCPGSLALYANDIVRRKVAKYRPRPRPIIVSETVPHAMRVPDLSAAPCRTARGAELVKLWQRSTGTGQQRVGRAVSWMCNRRCPVRERCELFTQVNEYPAGSWGGIYAGRNPAERKADAVRRSAVRDASRLWPCWPIAQRVIWERDRLAPAQCSPIVRTPPVPQPEPPRPKGSSADRGRLRGGQRLALGLLGGRPWGVAPRSDRTWASLQTRGLAERVPGGLRLTASGYAALLKLDESDAKS